LSSAGLLILFVKFRSLLQAWLEKPRNVSTKRWYRNMLKNSHLENQGVRTNLRWILGKQVVRMGFGRK
jgi:hypothetical protein